jgi:GNAT superfamily N-acetyltransferase
MNGQELRDRRLRMVRHLREGVPERGRVQRLSVARFQSAALHDQASPESFRERTGENLSIRPPGSAAEWLATETILRSMRPDLPEGGLVGRWPSLRAMGMRILALFSQDKEIYTVASAFVMPHVQLGRVLWIGDLVTAPHRRSLGYGTAMLRELSAIAKREFCARLALQCFANNPRALSFYVRNGFEIHACALVKGL